MPPSFWTRNLRNVADTVGYLLEEPELLWAQSTQVALSGITNSLGYLLEDEDLQWAQSTEISPSGIIDTPGYLIEEPELLWAQSTVPIGGGIGTLPSSPGYLLIDESIFTDVYKYDPTESAFEILATPTPKVLVRPRRAYEGDIAFELFGDVYDISISQNDLTRDTTLQTAIMLSLFSDRRAAGEDLLPAPGDLRGWWADNSFGSKLWLYSRAKLNEELLGAIAQEAVDSLRWLVTDKVASRVNVLATRYDNETVALRIRITLPRRKQFREFRFLYNIEKQLLR